MAKKYIMFIDETGDSDIDVQDQPFTLTGVIFEYKYAVSEDNRVPKLKSNLMYLN